jgi:hypothetical protein
VYAHTSWYVMSVVFSITGNLFLRLFGADKVGRAGYKHEIFGPALLLASRAGGFMDNAVLAVDGGRNMVSCRV